LSKSAIFLECAIFYFSSVGLDSTSMNAERKLATSTRHPMTAAHPPWDRSSRTIGQGGHLARRVPF
jgi:hypothetical protein